MAITTRGGKQTIDPPMPSNENEVTIDNDKVVNVDANLEFGEGTKKVQKSYWVDHCGHYLDPSWYLLS